MNAIRFLTLALLVASCDDSGGRMPDSLRGDAGGDMATGDMEHAAPDIAIVHDIATPDDLVTNCGKAGCPPGYRCDRDGGVSQCASPPQSPPPPVNPDAYTPQSYCGVDPFMGPGRCCQQYTREYYRNGMMFTETWTNCGPGWVCTGQFNGNPMIVGC